MILNGREVEIGEVQAEAFKEVFYLVNKFGF